MLNQCLFSGLTFYNVFFIFWHFHLCFKPATKNTSYIQLRRNFKLFFLIYKTINPGVFQEQTENDRFKGALDLYYPSFHFFYFLWTFTRMSGDIDSYANINYFVRAFQTFKVSAILRVFKQIFWIAYIFYVF